jgi:hypothetical protein
VLQTDTNPVGVPQAAFEGLQAQLAANRSEFYRAVPSGPFSAFRCGSISDPPSSTRGRVPEDLVGHRVRAASQP